MQDANEVELQVVDSEHETPTTREERIRAARRQFLRQALAVTSGLALADLLPSALVEATTQAQSCQPGNELVRVGEIASKGGKLQAVIKVVNGNRIVPNRTDKPMLRYFAGYTPDNITKPVWPTTDNAGPGPTLRCQIGDSVQITLINQVDVEKFAGSLYSGEKGTPTGCDEVQAGNYYPANDRFPNCFHASSAANMHFHGTHVTPSTTGDNILVNIQPAPKMTDEDIRRIQMWFQPIFNTGVAVKNWNDLPKAWRDSQIGPSSVNPKGLIGQYDDTAPYNGGYGFPPGSKLRLWPRNDEAIKSGEWPQYYVGSYPICFRIPRYAPVVHKMGQAPGTHWYHAHKHGSTSVNLFNGMAGVLVIEDNLPGGYDGALNEFYGRNPDGKPKLEQVVLVFQQITDTVNLLVGNAKAPTVFVNGQVTPTIKMRPGQVQMWRMVNATVSSFITGQFKACSEDSNPPQLQCKQTAQDGVQFSRTNYVNQPLGNNGQNPIAFPLAPANRIDLLVQAPTTPGLHVMQTPGSTPRPILFVQVTNDTPISQPQMQFPPVNRFPMLPPFLADINADEIQVRREINYGVFVPNLPKQKRQPPLAQWTINGKQFEDGVVNQTIKLGAVEEWTVYNTTTQAAHPFHIHVNPFQVVEVFDPNAPEGQQLKKADKDFTWWDTFAIPKAKQDANGNIVASGYFKMRSRFVDFTGMYVQHCHILAHEDRGMMQLIQVCRDLANCSSQTKIRHH